MNSLPQKGAGAISAVSYAQPICPDAAAFVSHFLARLPVAMAEAVVAFASSGSHRVVHHQVMGAHTLAELARAQSARLASASRGPLPAGPWQDAVDQAARLNDGLIETWLDAANGYGRAFGRKAFAFPVTPVCRD